MSKREKYALVLSREKELEDGTIEVLFAYELASWPKEKFEEDIRPFIKWLQTESLWSP